MRSPSVALSLAPKVWPNSCASVRSKEFPLRLSWTKLSLRTKFGVPKVCDSATAASENGVSAQGNLAHEKDIHERASSMARDLVPVVSAASLCEHDPDLGVPRRKVGDPEAGARGAPEGDVSLRLVDLIERVDHRIERGIVRALGLHQTWAIDEVEGDGDLTLRQRPRHQDAGEGGVETKGKGLLCPFAAPRSTYSRRLIPA